MSRINKIILFTILTMSLQLEARSQIATCEVVLSETGALQRKVQWPSDLVYRSGASFYQKMQVVLVGHDDVLSIYSSTKAKNAIRFLATQKFLSMTELIALWELAIQVIRDGDSNWKARRAEGTDGSVIYHGPYGPALVIRPDRRIFRGTLIKSLSIGETWSADYTGWTEILPNFELRESFGP